jgi:hypothetical protein
MSVRNKKVMPLSKARGNGPEKDKTLENRLVGSNRLGAFWLLKTKKVSDRFYRVNRFSRRLRHHTDAWEGRVVA